MSRGIVCSCHELTWFAGTGRSPCSCAEWSVLDGEREFASMCDHSAWMSDATVNLGGSVLPEECMVCEVGHRCVDSFTADLFAPVQEWITEFAESELCFDDGSGGRCVVTVSMAVVVRSFSTSGAPVFVSRAGVSVGVVASSSGVVRSAVASRLSFMECACEWNCECAVSCSGAWLDVRDGPLDGTPVMDCDGAISAA